MGPPKERKGADADTIGHQYSLRRLLASKCCGLLCCQSSRSLLNCITAWRAQRVLICGATDSPLNSALAWRGESCKSCGDEAKATVAGLRSWEPLVRPLRTGGLCVMVAGLIDWVTVSWGSCINIQAALIREITACPGKVSLFKKWGIQMSPTTKSDCLATGNESSHQRCK